MMRPKLPILFFARSSSVWESTVQHPKNCHTRDISSALHVIWEIESIRNISHILNLNVQDYQMTGNYMFWLTNKSKLTGSTVMSEGQLAKLQRQFCRRARRGREEGLNLKDDIYEACCTPQLGLAAADQGLPCRRCLEKSIGNIGVKYDWEATLKQSHFSDLECCILDIGFSAMYLCYVLLLLP